MAYTRGKFNDGEVAVRSLSDIIFAFIWKLKNSQICWRSGGTHKSECWRANKGLRVLRSTERRALPKAWIERWSSLQWNSQNFSPETYLQVLLRVRRRLPRVQWERSSCVQTSVGDARRRSPRRSRRRCWCSWGRGGGRGWGRRGGHVGRDGLMPWRGLGRSECKCLRWGDEWDCWLQRYGRRRRR